MNKYFKFSILLFALTSCNLAYKDSLSPRYSNLYYNNNELVIPEKYEIKPPKTILKNVSEKKDNKNINKSITKPETKSKSQSKSDENIVDDYKLIHSVLDLKL